MKKYYKMNKLFFYNKTKPLERVQTDFNNYILKKVSHMERLAHEKMKSLKGYVNEQVYMAFEEEVWSNLREFQLNIGTIVVNFQRITGLQLQLAEDNNYIKKHSKMTKIKVFFLLDRNTAVVYSKKLKYLEEELTGIILNLEYEFEELLKKDIYMSQEDIEAMSRKYFKISSDMSVVTNDVNDVIDLIYSNISRNRDKNINLSFMLVSAILSIILFFPEFNNMLNLKESKVEIEDVIDDMIYKKIKDEYSLDELITIKKNSHDIASCIEDQEVREFFEDLVEKENASINRETNRIDIFLKTLLIILIPFVFFTIFIAL